MAKPSIPYAVWRAARLALEAEHCAASHALRSIPGIGSGPMGLTPDSIKALPEYRAARDRFNRAHSALGQLNRGNAAYCRELDRERKRERLAAMA